MKCGGSGGNAPSAVLFLGDLQALSRSPAVAPTATRRHPSFKLLPARFAPPSKGWYFPAARWLTFLRSRGVVWLTHRTVTPEIAGSSPVGSASSSSTRAGGCDLRLLLSVDRGKVAAGTSAGTLSQKRPRFALKIASSKASNSTDPVSNAVQLGNIADDRGKRVL